MATAAAGARRAGDDRRRLAGPFGRRFDHWVDLSKPHAPSSRGALAEQNRLLARQYAENGIRTFDLLDGAVDQDVLRGLPWMVEAVTASRGNPEYEALSE